MNELLNNFHFLRPAWLFLLIPVGIIAILMVFSKKESESWRNTIASHLLPYLMVKGSERFQLFPKVLLIVFFIIGIIGVAGPTWKQVEKPGSKAKAVLLVAVDLSLSMLAEDIQPNRLERARQKVGDLLKANPGTRTALIGYAGTAHLVTPLTSDYATINHHLEALSPRIIPLPGTNLPEVFTLADSILKKVEVPATLLIVTDDITTDDVSLLKGIPDSSKLSIQHLLIATPGGAPIPGEKKGTYLKDNNGKVVIPRLNLSAIREAGTLEKVDITTVTLDDSDVKIIAENIKQNIEYELAREDEQSDWQDFGYFLVFPIALVALFWFRKGWMVQWCWLIILPYLSGCSPDFRFVDLWLTKDQQGRYYYEKGEFELAAESFESPMWKGLGYYRAGNYQRAAAEFIKSESPQGYYNLGLAQVQLENYPAAVDAFDTALKMYPDYQEAAENKKLVADFIEKNKKKPLERLEGQLQESGEPGFSQELDKESFGDEEAEKEETGGGQPPGDKGSRGIQQPQEEPDFFPGEAAPDQESQNLKETMLRKMSNDPAEFLRRKFIYQYQLRKEKPEKSGEIW